MKAPGALGLAVLLTATLAAPHAAADPAGATAASAGVSLTIPPRIEVRAEEGATCARSVNAAAGLLDVVTETGARLPACEETTASVEILDLDAGPQTLLVTPV